MKKGSYRYVIHRSTEVLITIKDPIAFAASRLAWLEENPDGDYLAAMAVQVERDEAPVTPGSIIKIDVQDFKIDQVRTCRYCGCTENDACSLSTGPCSWVAEDLCSNPFCISARQAEKEVHHG